MRAEMIIMGMMMKTGLAFSFIAVLFIVWSFVKTKKSSREKDKRSEMVISKAIVLSIEKTGFIINNLPEINLLLQVFPERGRNFVTEIKEILSSENISAIHAGSIIKVKYNAENTKEISLIEAE